MAELEIKLEDYLKEMDKKLEMISITFDPVFKKIFESNLDLLKRFLNEVLELNLDLARWNIYILSNQLLKENSKKSDKTINIYVILNEKIYINIESECCNFPKIKLWNSLYDYNLSNMYLYGEKNAIFYQLNFDTKDKTVSYGEDIIVSYGLKTKSIYTGRYTILKYLEFYRKLYYTENEVLTESEIWLAAFTARNFGELNEMLSHILSVAEREKFIGEMIRISQSYFGIRE